MDFNELVPGDTRYVPFTQEKYHCVPTCVQMVMYRLNIPLVPAEQLGHHMGIVVPEEDAGLFWKATTGEMPQSGWGTRIYLPEFSLDTVFNRLNIPLAVEMRLINQFENPAQVREFLEAAQASDEDVLVCYQYGALFDTKSTGGHVNVFDRINEDDVRLVDPERTVPKWRTVKLDKLFDAMKAHGPEKSGGFWVLKATSQKRAG